MKLLYSAAMSAALSAGCAFAEQTYSSYGEAIDQLIDPSSDDFVLAGPGTSPTSCGNLYADAFDFLTPSQTRDPEKIGPNLIRNCTVSVNGAYGSTRSLGFASDVPTSTFIPFDTDRARQQIQEENDQSGSVDSSPGAGRVTISSSGRVAQKPYYVWADLGTSRTDATAQEPKQKTNVLKLGAVFFSDRRDRGVMLSFGASSGRSDAPESFVTDYPFAGPQIALYDAYRDACDTIRGGRTQAMGVSVTGFLTKQLGTANLDIYGGAAVSRTNYTNDLCYYTVQDNAGPVYASRIEGDTYKLALSTGVALSSAVQVGRLTLFPSIGADYTHETTPGYRETEAGISSVQNELATNPATAGDPISSTPVLTGASMKYKTQTTESLRARIGVSAWFPRSRWDGVSASLFYVNEIFDDPQTVTATFNEDRRSNPKQFRFQTNALPSDYFEVGLGYHRAAQRPGKFGWDVRLSSWVGEKIYKNYSISLALRSAF